MGGTLYSATTVTFIGRMRSQYIQQLMTRTLLLSHLVEISGCFEIEVHVGGAKASAKHFEVKTVPFWEGGLSYRSVVNASKEHSYMIRQTADELLA